MARLAGFTRQTSGKWQMIVSGCDSIYEALILASGTCGASPVPLCPTQVLLSTYLAALR